MIEKIYNVLVLCTGNSSRSIMAEAIINTVGKDHFCAYSAGSHPTGKINPFAIEQIANAGYSLNNLRSKSWNEFIQTDAPQMDFIITVCNNAAEEMCPIWQGQPTSIHWDVEDPAAITGNDEEKHRAFEKTFLEILGRVQLFVNLPLA